MAYPKTIWENIPSKNTPLSAEKLNNIENGIEVLDTRLTTAEREISAMCGMINICPASVAPNGYLLCDGSLISRTTYANLFSVIGTTFGAGDGSTTFNLPNLKGKIPVGYNASETEFNTLGKTGGEKAHKLTINEMPSHTHKPASSQYAQFTVHSRHTSYGSPDAALGNNIYNAYVNETQATGGGQAHNNLQPYIVLNYIIKY